MDADALQFWSRVEQRAETRWRWALFCLRQAIGQEWELEAWELVILAHRALVWAEVHRCIAERPRSAFWYVKAGA